MECEHPVAVMFVPIGHVVLGRNFPSWNYFLFSNVS